MLNPSYVFRTRKGLFMRETMIDVHIVVLLITIAHCNIYINKVVFWLFLGYPLWFNIGNQWHLYFLSRVQYSLTWHVLQSDMPANVSEALCCMSLKGVCMCGAELDLCRYIYNNIYEGESGMQVSWTRNGP